MNLAVSDASPLPLYQQIYDQLSAAILRGELASGEALPPIRTVASELRISVISVKRAWEELDRDGFIVTSVGRGSFVADLTAEKIAQKRRRLMKLRLEPGLEYCRQLGAGREEIERVLLSWDK